MRVLERESGPRREGSAIGLWPNAFRALDTLGLAEPLREAHPLFDRCPLPPCLCLSNTVTTHSPKPSPSTLPCSRASHLHQSSGASSCTHPWSTSCDNCPHLRPCSPVCVCMHNIELAAANTDSHGEGNCCSSQGRALPRRWVSALFNHSE